jgi:hypothetical protein
MSLRASHSLHRVDTTRGDLADASGDATHGRFPSFWPAMPN